MKVFLKGLIVISGLLIQLTILNLFALQGLKPDLMFVIVLVFALSEGAEEGAVVGFFSGILQDIFSVGLLGVHALIKTVTGFISGILRERIFAEHILFVVPLITLFATIVKGVLMFLVLRAFDMELNNLFWSIKQVIIPEALYNSLLSPFIYLGVKKLFQIIENRF